MNIVIYARYSSENQTEQSIDGQLKVCREYAKRNGYTVVDEYIDRAMTGTNDKRPDFQRMIRESAKGGFEAVLVYKLDRFSRDVADIITYIKLLRKNHIKFFSACESFSDDPSGRFLLGMMAVQAEFFSDELSEKIRRGMDISADKHQSTGGNVALGFRTEKKMFFIDENTAPVVKRIFAMYLEGNTMAEIIRYLNEKNVKTSRGNEYNKNSIHRILTNPRYIGCYTYNGEIYPQGTLPQIIDNVTFEEVRKRMAKNKKAPARAKAKVDYILSTKLYCGYCEHAVTGISGTSKTGDKHHYYQCVTNRRDKSCGKKNVRKDYLEDKLVYELRDFLTKENIAQIAAEVVDLYKKEQDTDISKYLKSQIKQHKKAIENLFKILEQADEIANDITERIATKKSELSKLEQQLKVEEHRIFAPTADEIRFFLSQFKKGDINSIEYRQGLVDMLVSKLFVYENKLTVFCNIKDSQFDIPLDEGSSKGHLALLNKKDAI